MGNPYEISASKMMLMEETIATEIRRERQECNAALMSASLKDVSDAFVEFAHRTAQLQLCIDTYRAAGLAEEWHPHHCVYLWLLNHKETMSGTVEELRARRAATQEKRDALARASADALADKLRAEANGENDATQ